MKKREIESLILRGYNRIIDKLAGEGSSARLHGYERAVRHRSRFESCGRTLTNPHGHEVVYWCRRPVCPTCAGFWARKIGRALVNASPESATEDYRMVTLIFGLAPTPDGAFDLFRSARRALSNAVDYRRRAAGIDRGGWLAFGAAGTLELDAFEAGSFTRLGFAKQAQYRAMGFMPKEAQGPQWVATAHLVAHVGALGEAAVTALFEAVAPVVHVQPLHADRSLVENAERVVGYAAKLKLSTTLSDGETRPWPLETVAEFVAACMRCSHGRQGFKLAIQPKRAKKIMKSQHQTEDFICLEPMPVLM